MSSRRLLDAQDDERGRRQLDLAQVETFDGATDAVLALPADGLGFALLLVGDATGMAVKTLAALAEASISRGACWVSTWGPDCERVHDIFDEVAVGDGLAEPASVLTTWHDDEPLSETLSFFWDSAFCPGDRESGPLRLVIAVGDRASALEVARLAALGLPDDQIAS